MNKRDNIKRVALNVCLRVLVLSVFAMLPVAAFSQDVISNAAPPTQKNPSPIGWYLLVGTGYSQFVIPKRSASVVSDSPMGVGAELSVIQRPLGWLGVGVSARFLSAISKEDDAKTTFGASGMLLLRFFLPVGDHELFAGPEAGYVYLIRRVDFVNADRVSFQGAGIGASLGGDFSVRHRFKLGIVTRLTYVTGGRYCADDHCDIPYQARHPGAVIFLGVHGAFRIF